MGILIPFIIFLFFRYRSDIGLLNSIEKIKRSIMVLIGSSKGIIDGDVVGKSWFEQFGLFYIQMLLAMIMSVIVYTILGAFSFFIILIIYLQNKRFHLLLQKYLSNISEKIYSIVKEILIQTTQTKKKPPGPVESVPPTETKKNHQIILHHLYLHHHLCLASHHGKRSSTQYYHLLYGL